jgi:hypothetical protein
MSDEIFRTTDVKCAAYAQYAFGAKILRIEPINPDIPHRLHFVLSGVPVGARLTPAEGELVDLAKYLRAFENVKGALNNAARAAGLR